MKMMPRRDVHLHHYQNILQYPYQQNVLGNDFGICHQPLLEVLVREVLESNLHDLRQDLDNLLRNSNATCSCWSLRRRRRREAAAEVVHNETKVEGKAVHQVQEV